MIALQHSHQSPIKSNPIITETTDPLLIAREGAAILQISVPTFWRRVADGTQPPAPPLKEKPPPGKDGGSIRGVHWDARRIALCVRACN